LLDRPTTREGKVFFMEENWRFIPGYENMYMVSDKGNVKGVDRKDGAGRKIKGKILKATDDGRGYDALFLCKKGKAKNFHVHRLVVWAYLGFNGRGYEKVVHHIDGDKKNNNLSNLDIISHRENVSLGMLKRKKHSKYIGVCWHKGNKKWCALIQKNKKPIFLGYFKDEYAAHLAYEKAKKQIMNG